MPQDDQNRDRQNDNTERQDWQGQNSQDQDQGQTQGSDEMTRESRSSGYSESEPDQIGSGRQGSSSPELGDTDEMDDEDRDEDLREDGSPNRRNNIG